MNIVHVYAASMPCTLPCLPHEPKPVALLWRQARCERCESLGGCGTAGGQPARVNATETRSESKAYEQTERARERAIGKTREQKSTTKQKKVEKKALTMNAALCSLSAVGRSIIVSRIWMRVLAST